MISALALMCILDIANAHTWTHNKFVDSSLHEYILQITVVTFLYLRGRKSTKLGFSKNTEQEQVFIDASPLSKANTDYSTVMTALFKSMLGQLR